MHFCDRESEHSPDPLRTAATSIGILPFLELTIEFAFVNYSTDNMRCNVKKPNMSTTLKSQFDTTLMRTRRLNLCIWPFDRPPSRNISIGSHRMHSQPFATTRGLAMVSVQIHQWELNTPRRNQRENPLFWLTRFARTNFRKQSSQQSLCTRRRWITTLICRMNSPVTYALLLVIHSIGLLCTVADVLEAIHDEKKVIAMLNAFKSRGLSWNHVLHRTRI